MYVFIWTFDILNWGSEMKSSLIIRIRDYTSTWICHGDLKPSALGTEVGEAQPYLGTQFNEYIDILPQFWTPAGCKMLSALCAASRETHWPVRMLHPADPLWGLGSWPHPRNKLGCGARRPSVQQSASGPSNLQDAPPLCSGQPYCWADGAAPLQTENTPLEGNIW